MPYCSSASCHKPRPSWEPDSGDQAPRAAPVANSRQPQIGVGRPDIDTDTVAAKISSATAAAAAWASASVPLPSAAVPRHACHSYTGASRIAAMAALGVDAPALPYAAARPLLCSSDGAADDAAATAAAGCGAFPLRCRLDEEGNPMLPTPPLSLHSSYSASLASSAADLEPLETSAAAAATATAAGSAAACAAVTGSWGSAGDLRSEDVCGAAPAGIVCSTSDPDVGSSGSSSSSSGSTGSGSDPSSRTDVQKPWSSGDLGACGSSDDGGGDAAGGGGGGVPFVAAAASLPATPSQHQGAGAGTGLEAGSGCTSARATSSSSTSSYCGPKRAQLSISLRPASLPLPLPLSQPAPLTARASHGPTTLTLAAGDSLPSSSGRPSSAVVVAAPPNPPPPQPQHRHQEPPPRVAELTAIRVPPAAARLPCSTSTASTTLLEPAVAAAAAAAVDAGPAPGDGILVVGEADSEAESEAEAVDLEGVDVVANIDAVARAPGEGAVAARHRGAGGGGGGEDVGDVAGVDAAAAVLVGTAAAGAGGDGDDGGAAAAAGALPVEVRRRLNGHMGRQRAKGIRNWKDLSHSTASQPPGYWLLGTMLLLSMMAGTFLFMAGQYDFVRPIDLSTSSSQTTGQALANSLQADPLSRYSWGPTSLRGWMSFWRSPSARTFTFDYLRLWGGRYGPDLVAGQWWRWVTSLLLHQSSMHLASNVALFLVLSAYLESLFGCWRVLPVWLVAGVAGNMVSAFFESPCMLVVGSSGAVFGLLGAYVADAALNWESIPLLWLRLAGMAAVAALLVALQVTGQSNGGAHGSSTSHASHIGGFLAGSLLALLLTPDFKAKRSKKVTELLRSMGVLAHLPHPTSPGGRQLYSFWQRHRVLQYIMYGAAVAMLLVLLVALPLTLYMHTFRRMVCG